MMRKKCSFLFLILAIYSLFIFSFNTVYAFEEKIYLGGMPAGFSLLTRGASIVGLSDVITEKGLLSPAKEAGLKVGDTILKIDGVDINGASDIEKSLVDGLVKNLTVKRCGEVFNDTITPAKDLSGNFKLGIFVRDNVNGIGTITYVKGNRFASLGHPVLNDNSEIVEIIGGDLFHCNITDYIKGERGKPGELRGIFIRKDVIGTIDKNTECGVFGTYKEINKDELISIETAEAVMGNATIYTTIKGESPKEYSITIIKVDNGLGQKNFVIKINDERLLECTGGIVQGMSGSPIVQNGKLVGAVTHVFINDPTRGFGVSIQNMLNN